MVKLTLVQTRALATVKAGRILHIPYGSNSRERGYHALHTSTSEDGRISWSTFRKAAAAPYDLLLTSGYIEDRTQVATGDKYGRSIMRLTPRGRRVLASQTWPAERLGI